MPTSLTPDELASVLERMIDGALETHAHQKLHEHASKGEFLELPVTIRIKFRTPAPDQQGFSREDICCVCWGPGAGQYGPPYCRGTCC